MMYSLYRAWLMRDAVAAATLATPPDVIINVGGGSSAPPGSSSPPRGPGAPSAAHQFAAHRAVLASHSGYLKALLTAATTSSNTVTISVPNVSPESFAPLLTFMYTGYLDVTHENIYGVLLATHLLHMPRALDLCRAFLVQNQHPPQAPMPPQSRHPSLPTLVKPIPSRKMLPVLLGLSNLPPPPPPPAPFWPPPTYHPLPQPPQLMLPSADSSPFRSVLPSLPMDPENVQDNSSALKLALPPPLEVPTRTSTPLGNPTRKRPKSPLAIPSTSTSHKSMYLQAPSPSSPSSVSPCLSGTSFSSEDPNVVSESSSAERQHKTKTERQQQAQPPQQSHKKIQHKSSTSSSSSNKKQSSDASVSGNSGNNSKVIIDVACCDGPVRFHRVLNDNYGLTLDDLLVSDAHEQSSAIINHSDDHHSKIQGNGQSDNKSEEKSSEKQPLASHNGAEIAKNNKQLQHQMKKNVLNHISDNNKHDKKSEDRNSEFQVTDKNRDNSTADGNSSSSSLSVASEKVSGNNTNLETVYTCLYCNHTFKSHYCYQKHARRHINPVTIDLSRLADRLAANKGVSVCKIQDKVNGGSGSVRREVRLLDMNVQYYPCKTCGSKFPSYYFVHKHRKMCHSNEETESLVGSEESRSQSQTATSV